jgi:hypothetical protein
MNSTTLATVITLDLDVDGKDMLDRLSSLDGWVDKFIVDSSGFSGTWYTTEDELFCLEHEDRLTRTYAY